MFTPITVPSRSSPETFATEAELAFAGLAQFILDYNQLGSILNTAITSTSTTSLAIGTGSKSLTVQTGLNLVPGYPIRLAYTTTPTDNMDGTVSTYNSSTGALVVNISSVNGSGTYASWQVMVLPAATGNFADKSTANTFTDVQTFTGGVSANALIKKQSDPTLGGALLLEKSSGSSLGGNVKVELSGNSIRIYENGGSNRGMAIDLTALGGSIASQIVTSAIKASTAEVIAGTDPNKYATAQVVNESALIQQGTLVTTTGSAAIDFSVASDVVAFKLKAFDVSTNGSSAFMLQLGTGGSPTTSGYQGNASGPTGFTAGFRGQTVSSTGTYSIFADFELVSGNTYLCKFMIARQDASETPTYGCGKVTLSGSLNLLRLTTVGGTDTFDSINANTSWSF